MGTVQQYECTLIIILSQQMTKPYHFVFLWNANARSDRSYLKMMWISRRYLTLCIMRQWDTQWSHGIPSRNIALIGLHPRTESEMNCVGGIFGFFPLIQEWGMKWTLASSWRVIQPHWGFLFSVPVLGIFINYWPISKGRGNTDWDILITNDKTKCKLICIQENHIDTNRFKVQRTKKFKKMITKKLKISFFLRHTSSKIRKS